ESVGIVIGPLFRPDHHRLVAHTTDHVKRIPRFATKGQLKGVFSSTPFFNVFFKALWISKRIGRQAINRQFLDGAVCSRETIVVIWEYFSRNEICTPKLPLFLKIVDDYSSLGQNTDSLPLW
ncbi:MAG: hypothetical protein SWE60_27425, partial [Thermodesulfobacteriota bacterium]|nr:hypothetical protein [Thermodesulfobacteriota bacterium]